MTLASDRKGMDTLSSALEKVRVQVAQRRLRLDDFFADFDRLRRGGITPDQFRRVLATNRITLTEAELTSIVKAFDKSTLRAASGNTRGTSFTAAAYAPVEVNYASFLCALKSEAPPVELLTSINRKPTTLEAAEEAQLRPTMHIVRHAIQAKGISIVPPFKDMDPLGTGKVTAAQFERCIPFNTLDPVVLKLIEKKYGDGEGNVYYMMWCRDVDETLLDAGKLPHTVGGSTALSSSPFFTGTYRNPNLSAEELVRILREQFALYRLRCEDYLRDFDRHKTGTVSAPQFESALGRLKFVKFALTHENVSTLVGAYQIHPPEAGELMNYSGAVQVNYVSFLYDTNPKNFPVVAADGQESTNYFLSTHAADTFLATDLNHADAGVILDKLRRLVRANRIYLSPVLRDFDRVRKGIYEHRTCTTSRFGRALATQNLILPQEELTLLIRKYTVPMADGSPSDEVNYYQFVQDVDPSQAALPEEKRSVERGVTAQLQRDMKSTRLLPATDVDGVLLKIARQTAERHLRVSTFFIDFDGLRSGIMPKEKFVTALAIAGIDLQGSELKLLQDAYASKKVRGHVDVQQFMRDVGSYAPDAVPSTALDGDPVAGLRQTLSKAAVSVGTVAVQSSDLGESDAALLDVVVRRIRQAAKMHNALLTPFFSDFDRSNRGKITKGNFVQALTRHRFILSEKESDLLCKAYAVPNDPEMADYRRFVDDVEHDRVVNVVGGGTSRGDSQTLLMKSQRPTNMGEEDTVSESALHEVLSKVCCFLHERNPRVSEFFPDGDELRHQHVSATRFQHCITMLGLHLSEAELHVLVTAFACAMNPGEVDYPAFVQTVRSMLDSGAGTLAVAERRMGSSTVASRGAASGTLSVSEEKIYTATMDKIRRSLSTRRTVSLPAFLEYDRMRKGRVKEGQFFSCLMSLGLQLTPLESATVCKAFSLDNGEMGYARFSEAVDNAAFTSAS